MRSQRENAVISILFFVFGGPGILLIYVPFWLTRFRIPADEPYWVKIVSCALIVAGVVPLVESAARFIRKGRGTLVPAAATEHLVVSGLYCYVRNPMYLGVAMSLGGEALLFRNQGLWVELALVCAGVHVFVCLYEERALTKRYGQQYAEYRRNVPRWLPRLSPWNCQS